MWPELVDWVTSFDPLHTSIDVRYKSQISTECLPKRGAPLISTSFYTNKDY
jgi:hypothetical protein